MKFKIPPRESKLDATGERYLTQWGGQIELEHYHRYLFAAQYSKGKAVLDIASGEGYGSFLLAQTAQKVCGVDIDGRAVQAAREKYAERNLSFHEGTCEKIPFPDGQFDVVVSFETLEHIGKEAQLGFLSEIKRVLRSEGVLIMSSPEKEVYDVFSPGNAFHVHEITRNEFKSMMSRYFRQHQFLSQSLLTGSLIQHDLVGVTGMDFYEQDDLVQITRKDKLERLEYLICVASDGPLPASGSSMYLDTYFDSSRRAHLLRPDGCITRLEQRNSSLAEQNNRLLAQGDLMHQNEAQLREQNKALCDENETLRQQNTALHHENQYFKTDNQKILHSASWRFTRPLRLVMALLRFDKRYLYDGIQSVRNQIWTFRNSTKLKHPRLSKYLIEPIFTLVKRWLKPLLRKVVYGLLSWTRQLPWEYMLSSAYTSDYQEDQDFSGYTTDVKTIAFYLPQFHRIPENDRWWGEGFTEWVNTKSAKPLFEGHYQPREPHNDFGYYDLSSVDILKKQAGLARRHGIYGFCFYHYYFHGKRLLEKPIELLLDHPDIDLPFCVCWANENWTKKWDGADHEILIAQEHSPEDDIRFIQDLSRYLKDPRYIRCGGKPVILIYRPLLLPEPRATFMRWRQYCRDAGIGEIAIWGVRGCFNQDSGMGLDDAIEAEVEFPPHLGGPLKWIHPTHVKNSLLKLPLVDYKAMVKSVLAQNAVADKLTFPIYRTAMLGWDNTARRNEMAYVFYGFSTRVYYKWLRHIIEDVRKKFVPDERVVFINAWNEWAEGTYLEPDCKYGYAAVNTTSKAIFDLPFLMRCPSRHADDELEHLIGATSACVDHGNVAVHAHVFYTDLVDELLFYINNIPVRFDCFITTDTESKKKEIEQAVAGRLRAAKIEVRLTPNIGRDVAPFLVGCRDVITHYDYVCHIHTKKSTHGVFGDIWREYLLEHLLGSRRLVRGILNYFHDHPQVGLIYPPVFSSIKELAVWGGNVEKVQLIFRRIGLDMDLPDVPEFPAGTMAWMRTAAMDHLLKANITYDDFEKESGQLDGTLAHAFERSLVYIVNHSGYSSFSFALE